ncbi:MAG: hypothetical protein K0S33_4209 [Bacteroidetes bacterium]|jgi:hypothetical protein|nr:hypothetical protein [Bacteroidota bacterium]
MAPKDQSIEKIISYLRSKYGDSKWEVNNFWDPDKFSIGLMGRQEGHLAYISTYMAKENQYFVSLEDGTLDDDGEPLSQNYTGISLEELERLVVAHLKLLL